MAHLGLCALLHASRPRAILILPLGGKDMLTSEITLVSSCMIISSYPTTYMNLWLKAEHFSTVQINELPTAYYATYALCSWLGTTVAAIYPTWAIFTMQSSLVLFATTCMIIWDIPKALKYVVVS